MKRSTFGGRHKNRGMTLLELVVVIVLIGGLLAVLSDRLLGSKTRAEYKLAQTQLNGLSQKIEQFQVDVSTYPDSLSQLSTAPDGADNWLGPYAKPQEFKDPWGSAIEYVRADDNSSYTLTSLGADRKAGGTGVDKDIVLQP